MPAKGRKRAKGKAKAKVENDGSNVEVTGEVPLSNVQPEVGS